MFLHGKKESSKGSDWSQSVKSTWIYLSPVKHVYTVDPVKKIHLDKFESSEVSTIDCVYTTVMNCYTQADGKR